MTFAQYCLESGYSGSLLNLLPGKRAPQNLLDQFDGETLKRADELAFRACLGGAGGPAPITLGQLATASGVPVLELAKRGGITHIFETPLEPINV